MHRPEGEGEERQWRARERDEMERKRAVGGWLYSAVATAMWHMMRIGQRPALRTQREWQQEIQSEMDSWTWQEQRLVDLQ